MKFELTIRPYEAGIGQPHRERTVVLDTESFREGIEEYYSRPDFNPDWRLVDVRLVLQKFACPLTRVYEENAADQDGTVRAEPLEDGHAEQSIPSGLHGRT